MNDYTYCMHILSATSESFVNDDGKDYPERDIDILRKDLEDKMYAFLARVSENKPTDCDITKLRRRYTSYPTKNWETSVLSKEFRVQFMENLKDELVKHWDIDISVDSN